MDSSPVSPSVAVVVPVYNEEATITTVLDRILLQKCVAELIVVDDCSTDGTWDKILRYAEKKPTVRVFRHAINGGKGAALRTAFKQVTAPLVVIQDADFEYDPACYPELVGPLLEDRADVVFGSRFICEGPHRVLYFWHSMGNHFLTLLSNMMTNLNLTDMETCYKAFRSEYLSRINLRENRFGIEPELTAKLARLRPRIYEIGIPYYGRTYDEGKKITWKDGFRAIWCIVKYRFLD